MSDRFHNFYLSDQIYRTDYAMTYGIMFFRNQYKTTPVFAIQFANRVGDKEFGWSKDIVYFFPNYNQIYNLCYKLKRLLWVLDRLLEKKVDNKVFENIQKKYSVKIANPEKQRYIYINISNNITIDDFMGDNKLGVFLQFKSGDNKYKFPLTKGELESLYNFVKQIVDNYIELSIFAKIEDSYNQYSGNRGSTFDSSDDIGGSSNMENTDNNEEEDFGGGDFDMGINIEDDIPF